MANRDTNIGTLYEVHIIDLDVPNNDTPIRINVKIDYTLELFVISTITSYGCTDKYYSDGIKLYHDSIEWISKSDYEMITNAMSELSNKITDGTIHD